MTQQRKLTIVPETVNGEYIGNYTYDQVVRASWCYAHGELEELIGYDIFSLLKSELSPNEIQNERWVSDELKEGIYTCNCMDKDCTFFRWWNGRHFSGLVVLNTDKEHYNDALQKFNTKAISI